MKRAKRIGSFALCLLVLAPLVMLWLVLVLPKNAWDWLCVAAREIKVLWEITGSIHD